MHPKDSGKPLVNPWTSLKDGECFFVPCLDPNSARIFWLELGYEVGKMPPKALIGTHRGLHGVLCFRDTKIIKEQRRTSRRAKT